MVNGVKFHSRGGQTMDPIIVNNLLPKNGKKHLLVVRVHRPIGIK